MQPNNLAYASPESLGIPSQSILAFLDEIESMRLPMHGFLLIRHGKVAAEGYWPPFDENRMHRMYSVSKSFTALAIGMLVDEGKLKLDDRVASFFPEYLPENPHPYMLEVTIRNLLMMAACNEKSAYTFDSPDFVAAFFRDARPKHKPGTFFKYDTAGTTVLCAVVEKLTGKPLLEYMRPVLDEIGFSKDAWCIQTPEGRSWTGSGILCTPRDLARIAMFTMNMGGWNGKQLIGREYIEAATARQIDNTVSRNAPGRAYGYGYQIWGLKEKGFCFSGLGGQFAFCMPKHDAILVTTADTQAVPGAEEVLLGAYYRLLDRMADDSLPEDAVAQAALKARVAALALPLPVGKKTTPLAIEFSGKLYTFEENEHRFQWMRVEIADDLCLLRYENPTGEHALKLGMGHYEPQLFPEKYYGGRIGVQDRNYRSIGAGAWVQDNALIGTIYAVDDYIGTLKLQLTFSRDELCVYMSKFAEHFFDEYTGFLTGHAFG